MKIIDQSTDLPSKPNPVQKPSPKTRFEVLVDAAEKAETWSYEKWSPLELFAELWPERFEMDRSPKDIVSGNIIDARIVGEWLGMSEDIAFGYILCLDIPLECQPTDITQQVWVAHMRDILARNLLHNLISNE